MSEPVIRTVTAETTISEDLSTVFEDYRRFVRANRDVVIIVSVIGLALIINRSILRRELKRLNFTAEFFPYDMIDEDALAAYGG